MIPEDIKPLVQPTEGDPRPVVVMMCGLAGAGKSTLSKSILAEMPNYARLSIDQLVHAAHGMYGIDYPAGLYEQYQIEAANTFESEMRRLLTKGSPTNVVLDRSFYAKSDRDDFRQIARDSGARCVLVYLQASKEVLWGRIQQRAAATRNADSAFDMTEEILDRYIDGFEGPQGEDEIVIAVT